MPVSQNPDTLQLNSPDLYNVWKGQLHIQEQLACNIEFKSSGPCSIPAQLPSKLKITEVIRLSVLRKALPVQIFEQINLVGQEVCCEGVYYTLYAAVTSRVNGFEFAKFLEWMKDQELALIKGLNDQGFLVFLTSSALNCSRDLGVKDSFQLFALFLFPHTKLFDNTGGEHQSYKFVKEDVSLKISELLPGLQYAILETRPMQKDKNIYPDALVERHFKQFASLQRKSVAINEQKSEPSSTSSFSSGHGKNIADKCNQLAFSRLQSYFSSPINFSVPMVKMSTLLKEDIPVSAGSEKSSKKVTVKDSAAIEAKIPLLAKNKIKSDGSSGNNVLNENKKQPPKKRTFKKGGRRTRKGKRKHTHQAALSSSAASENQVSNKRKLIGGEQQQATASNRTTVKLASAPFTPGRKRGAEVLTLEFVNDDKPSETETTATNKRNKEQNTVLKSKVITGKPRKSALAEDTFVRDRPPKRKASEPGNRSKLPEVKSKSENGRRAVIKHQEPTGKQFKRTMESINTVSFEPVSSPSKSSTDPGLISKQPSVPEIDKKRISMYESHALNLLADLALNSLSSSSISYINSENAAPVGESVDQEKLPSSDCGKTGEYTQNDCSLPLKSSTASEDPVQAPDNVKSPPKVVNDASHVNSTTQHRVESTEKQASHKVLIAAAKAKARNNTTSKICLEHSYSQLPKDNVLDKSLKEQNESPCQNVSEPTVTSPDNEEEVDQSSDLFFPKDSFLGSSDSGCLSLNKEPREVSKCHDKLSITFKWEAQYDFDLDSKFTSDPLEKTINRALHGPWNPHLKEKVEDVKIILHMWLALFYSKPSQQQSSSSRKVVEHSNPAKYVSINTVHDPLYDNAEADADDTKYSDESGPQITPDASPEWHGVKEDGSSNQPVDLSPASRTQTKDIYVNLPSEIFQIYNKSSMSTLYTDSLQTMLCKMTSTSKVTPPPTNYTNTIFSANIPSVCYTDDSKQFNNELTAKSETCVAIGGGSSGKDKPRENEHKYSKHFSSGEETPCSSGSENRFNMLHEDTSSPVGKNEESAENYDRSVSPHTLSHTHADSFLLRDDSLPVIGNEHYSAATRSEDLPQDYPYVTSSTVDTEVSHSNALNVKSTSDVFHEDDGQSDHLETTEEDFLKKRSPLVSLSHSMQNIHANSEQNESMLESADGKKLLEAKPKGVNKDSADQQSYEDKLDTSNGHLAIASNGSSELRKCEANSYYNSDLKIPSFEENQTNTKVCNREDLSPLKSLTCNSSTSPLQDEKVSESRIKRVPTLESSRAASISLDLVHSENSSMQVESQDEATRSKDLLQESIKEVDTCIGTELNDCKDSSTDQKLTGNSFQEAKASSSTNEDALGSPKQCLDEPNKCQSSSLAENDTNEVSELWPGCPSYSQETEHSYVSKVASFGNMGKLELSPSSVENSDVENMDMDNECKSCPQSPENANKDFFSKEKSNLVDTSPGSPKAVFQQDDSSSPENNGSCINQNKKDASGNAEHSTEMNESEKTEETLQVCSHSPIPPSDLIAKGTNNLTTVSEYFESKGTETDDHNFSQLNEVENVSETDEIEDPCNNTDPFCDQEVRPLIGAEISGKLPKTCFGEKPLIIESEFSKATELESMEENRSLLASESSKSTDVKSLGSKSSLSGLESNMAADLQSQAEKSLLSNCESSEAANINDMAEKSLLHSTVSSKPEDSQCISVFEKLNLKAVGEVHLTQISTNATESELQISDIENLNTDAETMEKNQSVELLNIHTSLNVLGTQDQTIPNTVETGNSCEVLQTPSSKPLKKVIPLDGAATQPESRFVDGNLDQLPAETQSNSTSDSASVGVPPSELKKSTKVQTQIMRNKTRKEILSRLKLICRGSGINQQTSSNSDDEVFIVHEKPGKWHTEEQRKQTENKMVDVSKHETNTECLAENTSKTQEHQTPESEHEMVQEIAANSPSTTLVEPDIPQETRLDSQDKYVSPLHDFADNIEQDSEKDQSEICCILNTGSISKEQYDRWSETSDDDIEFIQAYKEPLLHKTSKYLQKECHDFPSPPLEEPVSYPEPRRSRKTKHFTRHFGPSTSLWEEDEYISRYHRGTDTNPRNHGSFIITRKLKDVEKSWPTVHKERFPAIRSELDSMFTDRRRASSDLTQNTLDMEHLRFMCRLKDVLRKSSTNIHVSEPPFQTLFDSSRISGGASSRTKCINPLLITVHCTNRKRNYRGHDSSFPSSSYNQAYYEDELWDKPAYYSRTPKKARTHGYSPPYHFNRLKYESTQEKANSDISMIIKECTQSNHLKLNRVGLGSTVVERTSACPAPEERGWQVRQTFDPTSTRSRTVGNIISDHCTNLRSKLQSVARDCVQKNSYFYISKANGDHDDDDFLSSTKSFLMKDGYIPIEPQDFCDREESESNKLLVLIKNENISAQIHKIPCLLQLRLLPNVMFAGVDTPEDLSESMYQELLQSGGFVVSYKSLLENISIDKLKEALTVLQKINRTSSWKWLIHYGEYRKLKEDKRVESASRIKMSLLKSYQQLNVIEILPYHQCDSRSKDPSSDLECLLNLQSQHIRSRLAVCLAAMPSPEAEEFEHNGILVYDVDTFIRRIQKVDARLQPSFWG